MKKSFLTTTRIIMLGFLLCALLGAGLLSLSVSLRPGVSLGFVDALFVAVSGTCVTGLTTVNIGQTFSTFGQAVLLVIIQIGGLGVVTFTTLVLVGFGHRLSLNVRMLIRDAYNLDTLSGLTALTVRIVKVTLCIEGLGALAYATVFIPEFGAKGIWYSVFHAVSAFCNAGIDLLGGNSLCAYVTDPVINITTILLIIVSGLGFPVYWEISRSFHNALRRGNAGDKRRMSFHARLVLLVTAILVVFGTALTLLLEWDNPCTLGPLGGGQKLMAALFQSVTLRTAGFATIDQAGFRGGSCLAYLILMFIGGSPAGTAGGVKTITVTLLIAAVAANIRGRQETTLLRRHVPNETIRKCLAIVGFSLTVLFALTILLLALMPYDFLDAAYEMTSAIATVGLSRGMTGSLTTAGKLIVALAMYLGRIGPITLALAFNADRPASTVNCPEGKVIVG